MDDLAALIDEFRAVMRDMAVAWDAALNPLPIDEPDWCSDCRREMSRCACLDVAWFNWPRKTTTVVEPFWR